MDHVAILRKANIKQGDDLLGDILKGTKTIESRWYVHKIAPWDKISIGDNVYFKESGCPISAKAKVSKVLQFEKLTKQTIKEIVAEYGKKIAPKISSKDFTSWLTKQRKKQYCILIFLKDVEKVTPFPITKSGYGISAAWLVTKDIDLLRI